MSELASVTVCTASTPHPCSAVSLFTHTLNFRGSKRIGTVILRDPCLLLLVKQNFGQIPVDLLTHLLVRGLLVVVPALKLIKVSEPIPVELLAPGYLGPEFVFKHGARRDVIRWNS